MLSSLDTEESHFNEDDIRFMTRCLELANQAAELGEVPVGAVIVLDGEIIAEGFNQPIGLDDPTAHAEIQVIRAAASALGNYRLPNTHMYVNVEPCSMCAGAIVHARIKHLIFGAAETKAGAVVSQSKLLDSDYLNHRVDHAGGCLADESSSLLKEFFRERRKQSKQSKQSKQGTS